MASMVETPASGSVARLMSTQRSHRGLERLLGHLTSKHKKEKLEKTSGWSRFTNVSRLHSSGRPGSIVCAMQDSPSSITGDNWPLLEP